MLALPPRTALHYACAYGQSEMVSLLLWYDCNIEARDQDESTALIKVTDKPGQEVSKVNPQVLRCGRQGQKHCDSTQALDVQVMKTYSQNLNNKT